MERATLDFDTSNSALEREIERPWFRHFIIILIVINAIVLGVLTYHESWCWRSLTVPSPGYLRSRFC